jgi:hypothetical protein
MKARGTSIVVLFVFGLVASACHGALHTGKGSVRDAGAADSSSVLGGQPSSTSGAAGGAGGVSTGGATAASGGSASGGSASGGNGAGGTGAVQEPVDTRPARPAWVPPFTAKLGTPGWQQSTQSICETNQGWGLTFGVWADTRGVYALLAVGCNEPADIPCGKDGASLKFNSGSGWQLVHQFAPPPTATPGYNEEVMGLWSGFPGGPLLMSGTLADQTGIYFVDGSDLAFQTAMPTTNGAFVAGSDLAYVIDSTRLLKYSAGTWSTLGEATGTLEAVWADSQSVVVVGENQTILMQSGDGPLTALPNVPAGNYTSVWAFGASDIWTGNSIGQLVHYDGKAWRAIPTGSIDTRFGVIKLWGADGIVYFITPAEMGRWNGSSVDMLLEPPAGTDFTAYPGYFIGLWGRSAQEVFVAMWDRRYLDYACGENFLLWFDGSQFHQF